MSVLCDDEKQIIIDLFENKINGEFNLLRYHIQVLISNFNKNNIILDFKIKDIIKMYPSLNEFISMASDDFVFCNVLNVVYELNIENPKFKQLILDSQYSIDNLNSGFESSVKGLLKELELYNYVSTIIMPNLFSKVLEERLIENDNFITQNDIKLSDISGHLKKILK